MPTPGTKRLVSSLSPPNLWRHYLGTRHFMKVDMNRRNLIYRRHGYRCVYCGYHSKKDLHIHHANRNPNDNRLGNLEAVCGMCHLILHAGYASEVLGILDFYADTQFSQNDVVLLTRRLRAKGMSDQQIRRTLGLRRRRPFIPEPHYLARLTGFISGRLPMDDRVSSMLKKMYIAERKASNVPREP
jgi:hypothetical protein